MTSIKNLKFPVSLFLDKMGIQIMFDEHLVKKKLTLDFGQKLEISSLYFFLTK